MRACTFVEMYNHYSYRSYLGLTIKAKKGSRWRTGSSA